MTTVPPPAGAGPEQPRLVHADGTAPRVLVVDDEQSLAEVLGSVLRREGWTARTSHTGLDAIRVGVRVAAGARERRRRGLVRSRFGGPGA